MWLNQRIKEDDARERDGRAGGLVKTLTFARSTLGSQCQGVNRRVIWSDLVGLGLCGE